MAATEAVSSFRARRSFPPLLFLGFTMLAIPVVRNLPLLIPPILILLAPGWTELDRQCQRAGMARLAVAVLALLVLTIGWLRLSDRLNGVVRAPTRSGWGIDADRFPVGAVDFLEEKKLSAPFLNDFDIGGYLLYRLHPARRVFIAGNTSMYPVSFFETYVTDVVGPKPDLDDLVARFHIETVVWDLVSPAGQNLFVALAKHPAWKLVYMDHAAVVFTTAGGIPAIDLNRRVADLAATKIYRAALPPSLGGKAFPYPALALPAFLHTIGRPDLALALAEPLWPAVPAEPLAALIGTSALQTGQAAARLPFLEDAVVRYPNSADLQMLLFAALAEEANRELARGETDLAEPRLERMGTLQPHACGPYVGLAKIAILRHDTARGKSMIAEALRRDVDGACRAGVWADPFLAGLM
jgi:hypothetical protein